MNKRNFLLDFALKSKYNFFACLVALLVLIFAVSSITYSWIEGATSLIISSGSNSMVYDGTNNAVNLKAQPLETDKVLNLSQYIDPSSCCLAPARGVEVKDANTVKVQFLKDDAADTTSDDSFRDADTNDISNNYIFFETKVKPNDDISNYKFTLGNIDIPSIKVAISVLDSNRNPLSCTVSTAKNVNDAQIACGGLNGSTEYILQFRIWNDVTEDSYSAENLGKDANIKFTMAPQANFVTLYLRDYTNSETKLKLLSDKTVKVVAGGKEAVGSKTDKSVYDQYEFEKVSQDSLNDVQFVAYNTDGTEFARWDLSGNAVAENSIYNVYGSAASSKTYGTFGELKKVSLVDKSAENLLKADKAVTMTSGTESYVMYHGTSSTDFSTYVPTTATNFKFNNSTYYAEEASAATSTTPIYYILGESQTEDNNKTKCVGFWSGSAYTSFNTITIIDRTGGRLVDKNANTVYVSYPDSGFSTVAGKLYKASYDSANKQWTIVATNSSFTNNEEGMVWTFKAYDSSGNETYSWQKEGRKAQNSTKYTFITADSADSDGTWGTYEVSQLNPYILYENSEKLVSFYGGVLSSWGFDYNDFAISKEETTDSSKYVQTSKYKVNAYKASDNNTYHVAKFTNVESYKYWLKHNPPQWNGRQISEAAKGGAFYGIYHGNSGSPLINSAISGATTLGGKTSNNASSPISLLRGPVAFTTVTSSVKSLLDENLYIEYFICKNGDENTSDYYCINPSVLDDGSEGDNCLKVASTSTSKTYDFTTDASLKAFIDSHGGDNTTFTLKTVLTDGTVYYVADTDYFKFTGADRLVNVKLNTVDHATATVTYGTSTSGTINEGDDFDILQGSEITLNVVADSGYEFEKFVIYESDGTTEIETINNHNYIYTLTDKYIVIQAFVKEQSHQYIYLQNEANWSGTPQVHVWVGGDSICAWNDSKSNMTLVSGNIWKYEIPARNPAYANVKFHQGNANVPQTRDLVLKLGYIYNNKTNKWSDQPYEPSGTTSYTVTYSQPANGTIAVTKSDNSGVSNGATVGDGTQLTITETPNSDFAVESITVNGTSVGFTDQGNGTTVGSYTVNGADVTISAVMKSSSSTARTIYFKNTADWTTVKAYIWDDNNISSPPASFPGKDMTVVDSANGIYSITISDDNLDRIIFTNKLTDNAGGDQSGDLTIPTDGKDLFTWDSNVADNGTWSKYSSSSGGADSIWYLVGNLNGKDASGEQATFNFKTTSDPNVFTLTYTFTGDNAGMQYLQMYNGTATYAPSSYQGLGENTESSAGVSGGKEKWGIAAPTGTKVTITWNANTKKIKWVKS